MLVTEYRIVMPFSVEEYQVGQRYCIAEASMMETGGGEGVEVLKNEPFDNVSLFGGRYTQGQYSHKKYHLASKIPSFIRMLAPKGLIELEEETWNAYPYCRTVITNPNCMKSNFAITIESLHMPDKGDQDNVLEVPGEKLKLRNVVMIDIAGDAVTTKDYEGSDDPGKFRSNKFDRGPLVGKWQDSADPVMTCYKLVTIEFKWLGLHSRVESFIQRAERRLLTNFHRQVFCWADKWHGATLEDIRELEERVREELEKQRPKGDVRGMKADTD